MANNMSETRQSYVVLTFSSIAQIIKYLHYLTIMCSLICDIFNQDKYYESN